MHIYTLVGYGGTRIQLQFYETTEKILYYTFDKDWQPLNKPRLLDPVEALAEIKKATGIGVEGASL